MLLRRIASERLGSPTYLQVPRPIRVKRDKFLKHPAEFSRNLQLAGLKCDEQTLVLILLDADDDCPAELGRKLVHDAGLILPHRKVAVVVANREFEAWFIAAAASLNGKRGLVVDGRDTLIDPERPRDAKGWLNQRMADGYGEVRDQSAFAAIMDLGLAFQSSRSFRKLCAELERGLVD